MAWKILAHEIVHSEQLERTGILGHLFLYFSPPAPVIGVFLGFVLFSLIQIPLGTVSWVHGLVSLLLAALFFIPWSSPSRRDIECEAYAVTVWVNFLRYGSVLDSTYEAIADSLCGPTYYWCSRDKESVIRMVKYYHNLLSIKQSTDILPSYLKDIYEVSTAK